MENCIVSGIFGLVIGDALGVPYEFSSRESLDNHPARDMVGYGTYNQAPGTWSDDSSLVLATLDSLTNGLDYDEIMDNFVNWFNKAEYTPHGEVFDIGIGTRLAIENYISGTKSILSGGSDSHSNGNGSLMRILPIAFYLYYSEDSKNFAIDEKLAIVYNCSSLTHRHKRSHLACGIYVFIALELLKLGKNSDLSLNLIIKKAIINAKEFYESDKSFDSELKYFNRIFSLEIANLNQDDINSSGYVLDTIEASIWCLLNTDSYESAILSAVNLGEDTDTTAAVVGGLAGIYYGYESIPKNWVDSIANFDFIFSLCSKFYFSLI